MKHEDRQNNALEERLSRLEEKVDRLERTLGTSGTAPPEKQTAPPTPDTPRDTAGEGEGEKRDWIDVTPEFGEKWLNRTGIGLLLLGVAFLFKYSVDQGWLIPPVRSATGLGIGLFLFLAGLRMDRHKKPIRQILAGGGIAVFYITGFATFQLYTFVPHSIVWMFMVVVTLLALSLSLQQNEAILSVTGIIGALGTPFMLYSGSGSVTALMIYTALVLSAGGWIYLVKGWRTLLWSMTAGGWVVIMVGIFNMNYGDSGALRSEQWALQAGVLVCMVVFWGIPVIRDLLSFDNPLRWPDPVFNEDRSGGEESGYIPASSAYVLVLIVPVFSFMFSMGIWNMEVETRGIIAMTAALPLAACYLFFSKKGLKKSASVHAFSGLIMLTIGFVLFFEGNALLLVLAMEAAGLRFIASRTGDENISVSSHVLFGTVALWWLAAIESTAPAEFTTDFDTILRLVIIAIGGLLGPFWMDDIKKKQIYGLTAHLFFLIWLYRYFEPLADSQAWITVAWGVYAVALFVLGFTIYGKTLRMTGLGTIFLVVVKLFLVDLSQLQAIWRILLFLGFGALFLLLGYYWQSHWNMGNTTGEAEQT